jgi:hypothetical protein
LPTGCWEYTGLQRFGYGRASVNACEYMVHRLVYEHFIGPIPEGLCTDHLCRNRRCANFEHLEVVANKENILRGESFSAVNARKTHCPRGHEYDGVTSYVTPQGSRLCRLCRRIRERSKVRKKKGQYDTYLQSE